jgi:thiamine-phosphate pyrophosphorylase
MRGLYLILDVQATAGRSPSAVAEAALRGGVDAVQWRQKTGSWAAFWPELLRTRELCRRHDVPFLVNDRIDVALAVHADGAHVGQDDLPAPVARDLLSHRVLGVSITDPDQLLPAVDAGADYLGVGPVFPTASKPDAAAPGGLELLRSVRRFTDVPLAAIGGITPGNAADVMRAGADAVAVLSAICSAADVEGAARALVTEIEGVMIR